MCLNFRPYCFSVVFPRPHPPPKLHGTNMIQLHPKDKMTFRSIVVGELFIAGTMPGNNNPLLTASVCGMKRNLGVRERGQLYLVLTVMSRLKSSVE